ncbi:hypothetical protein AMEX_G24723, partial [Astyanax mexicanus]
LTGPAACFDVIGYSRGSVIIFCNNKLSGNDGYFCKESTNQCVFMEPDHQQNSWDYEDRVSLRNRSGKLRVFYQDLSLEDAGLYQCGETGVWNQTVNLRVKTDLCCLGPKTVIGYLEETVTISCSYPEEFQTNIKTFYKQSEPYLSPVISTTESQTGRFSIFDNRRSRVVSVRISDVREDDGGVYYCGVWIAGNEVSYHPFYTQVYLQISGEKHKFYYILSLCNKYVINLVMVCSVCLSASGFSVIIIIAIVIIAVSICVVLLLIFYKLRRYTTQGSNTSSNMATTGTINQVSHSASDYAEIRDIRPHQDTQTTPLYSTLQPPTNPLTTMYVLAQRPSPSPAQGIYNMVQLPQPSPEAHGYSTVSFQNNPDSAPDASFALGKC